jgi:hypothetical protein
MTAVPSGTSATPEVIVEPLTGPIGAELRGVDLRAPRTN